MKLYPSALSEEVVGNERLNGEINRPNSKAFAGEKCFERLLRRASSSRSQYACHIHPATVTLHKHARLAYGELFSECRVCCEKSLNGCAVAGSNAPTSIFADQILLSDYLAFSL